VIKIQANTVFLVSPVMVEKIETYYSYSVPGPDRCC